MLDCLARIFYRPKCMYVHCICVQVQMNMLRVRNSGHSCISSVFANLYIHTIYIHTAMWQTVLGE